MIPAVRAVASTAIINGDVTAAVESRVMPTEPKTMVNPAKTLSTMVTTFTHLRYFLLRSVHFILSSLVFFLISLICGKRNAFACWLTFFYYVHKIVPSIGPSMGMFLSIFEMGLF